MAPVIVAFAVSICAVAYKCSRERREENERQYTTTEDRTIQIPHLPHIYVPLPRRNYSIKDILDDNPEQPPSNR
jgi:hypothetical protein